MPALLITGGQDPTTSPQQREAFRASSPRNSLTDFGTCGHFVHAEEPGAYARLVSEFTRQQAAG
jgi:pimeloyl-ACP methyl ester carboxylesterase